MIPKQLCACNTCTQLWHASNYSAEATTEIKKFPWVFKLRHNDSKMRTYVIGVAAKRELEVSRVDMYPAYSLSVHEYTAL